MDPSGIGFDLCLSVPVVIGTIPLRSTFSQFQPTPSPTISPSAPTLPANQDLPPTFSESKDLPPAISASKDLPSPFSASNDLPSPFSAYPDLPPPTYEEATGADLPSLRMEDDNEHATGNWDYKPIYPYYG